MSLQRGGFQGCRALLHVERPFVLPALSASSSCSRTPATCSRSATSSSQARWFRGPPNRLLGCADASDSQSHRTAALAAAAAVASCLATAAQLKHRGALACEDVPHIPMRPAPLTTSPSKRRLQPHGGSSLLDDLSEPVPEPHTGACAPISTKRVVVKSQQHLLKPTESNPMPTEAPPPVAALSGQILQQRFVVMMIGLPLRGKAHLSRRLKQYMEFCHGFEVELFNINEYVKPGGDEKLLGDIKDFFERSDEEREPSSTRKQDDHAPADKGTHAGRFGILYVEDTYGALPSTWSGHSKWQRFWIHKQLEEKVKAHTIFVEIQVDDSKEHRKHYIERLERSRALPPGSISRNVEKYAQHFVTIQDRDGTEDALSYMKLMNYNHKVLTHNMMSNSVGSRIAQFVASAHPYKRVIYLSRHGESEYNEQKKLGGDSPLSRLGREYAPRLAEFSEFVISGEARQFECVTLGANEVRTLRDRLSKVPPDGQTGGLFAIGPWEGSKVREGMRLVKWQLGYGTTFKTVPESLEEVVSMADKGPYPVTLIFVEGHYSPPKHPTPARLWTSSLCRTRETGSYIRHPIVELPNGKKWEQMTHCIYRNLDEVFAGDFEGFTYEEIRQQAPDEAKLRKMDKLGYRYPRGESYYDIIARLDRPMQHLETIHEPTLIIGHQAVHRLVYAFLTGKRREDAIELEIPLHTVIRLESDGTGFFRETRFYLGPDRLSMDDGQRHF